MRTSTLIAGAALAAGAFASPLKRDVEVDTIYDVSYETEYVTETEGATAAAVATSTSVVAVPATTSSFVAVQHYGHRHFKAFSSAVVPTTSAEVEAATPTGYTEAWTSTWASTWTISASAESSSIYSASTTTAAAATSAASSTEASTSSASTSKATTYQQIVLAHHNVHRANHSANALTWDSSLANTAATIAATCVYAHSMNVNGGGYGQNIAAGVDSSNVSAVITELFYNGEVNYFNNLYGQANPDMTNFESWGHFSQLVWKGTTTVGCATQYCSGGLSNVGSDVQPWFTVCNYGPPGNYGGEYGANIGQSLGKVTQHWNYDL